MKRLFILQSIKYVYKAEISSIEGYLDFSENLKKLKPDFFIVNEMEIGMKKESFAKNIMLSI